MVVSDRNKTVLIVEDQPEVTTLLRQVLEKDGFVTQSACNGAEALQKVAAAPPDAIILDFMLPGMNGLELNSRLKVNPESRDIPLFIVTGKGHLPELMELRRDPNVVAYLEKPFQIAVLLQKIREILV